jgi:hypothetical protein
VQHENRHGRFEERHNRLRILSVSVDITKESEARVVRNKEVVIVFGILCVYSSYWIQCQVDMEVEWDMAQIHLHRGTSNFVHPWRSTVNHFLDGHSICHGLLCTVFLHEYYLQTEIIDVTTTLS